MDKFKLLLSIAQKQQATLGFGLVALITAGGEQIFSAVVFKCPCSSWNFQYGLVFLLVPALVLLILGVILNNKTWKLLTGLCSCESECVCHFRGTCVFVQVCIQIFVSAAVAPITWIGVALLNGNYFECARTGLANVTLFGYHPCSDKAQPCRSELHLFPCKEFTVTVPPTERDAVMAIIRTESQVIGWLVIASIMTTFLLLTCVARCRSPISHVQLKFWQVYTQKENALLDQYTDEHAQKLAERNLTSFFQKTPPNPIVMPTREEWKQVSSLFYYSKKRQHYSMLQRHVETALCDPRRESTMSDGRAPPVVFDFADGGGLIP
ncbi:hypothetical protein COCON_G00001800 [Conger conger]|uniref:Calcium homeostasis modulator protein 6 n=1 Tax=Conger conger TaxID=82655 RepID=A0A9Q1I868_CONCO|nr:hypothetical protein COCON_G00001800 [Conger conger]